ncbi:MAG: hypothetical protein JW725_02660, partial [Candidatus Babeliaceae bacterium]|nr:hypothetical protein [Candidatus Babeliaceae bacterium]
PLDFFAGVYLLGCLPLIGPDRDLFLQGRQAESQGMGIGAYAYYRRIVENQKDRLIDEIIKVVEHTSTDQNLIEQLKNARQEQQFIAALDKIKAILPPTLLINGHHNPLKFLHQALSEHIHNCSDEQCLELARDIRVLLTEMAERINQILKDKKELDAALRHLSKDNDK